jgi:hypothetical protein
MKPLFILILGLSFASAAFSAPFPSWIASSKWRGSIEHKQTRSLYQIRAIIDPRYKLDLVTRYWDTFDDYDIHTTSKLSIQQNRHVIKLAFAQMESPRTYVFRSNGAVTAFIPDPSTGTVIACWGTWYPWHNAIYYRYVDEATNRYSSGLPDRLPSIITTGSVKQLSKRRVSIEESGSEQHQFDYYYSISRNLSFSGRFYIERQHSPR